MPGPIPNLEPLEQEILDHWKEHRPKMCKALGDKLIPMVHRR